MIHASRREFLETTTAAVLSASLGTSFSVHAEQPVHIEETGPMIEKAQKPALRCLPIVRGNLRPYNHTFSLQKGKEGWCRELDDEKHIGVNLLWLSHIQPALEDTETDTLQDIFDACAERDMGIIIETGFTPHWYGKLDLENEIHIVDKVCSQLAERYGDHPAFYAWYLHHELYFASGAFRDFIDNFFPAAVEKCKKALPDKPVTLSPFFILDDQKVFGDFYFPTHEEYQAYWTHLIGHSGFDIIMLQDSGEHFSYVTNEQRRPYFEAMHAACQEGGATLWGNVESAEMVCESIEQYVELYGRIHHSTARDIPWRNVPMDRFESKLHLAAEYAENIVSWGYYQFGRPVLGEEARVWYEEYYQYYKRIIAEKV